jgi:hypothetical protein
MWSTRRDELTADRGVKIAIDRASKPVSYADVLRHWQDDGEFRSFFISLLADAPYAAFRWETPPITAATANRPFEFVLLDSPGLARGPDVDAFAEHFGGGDEHVVAFSNLGKDATLIVPCPEVAPATYVHIAAFVRGAPETQQHALWRLVGKTMQQELRTESLWLSTAGAGVAWLHVRIDKGPKYYGYAPYRNER